MSYPNLCWLACYVCGKPIGTDDRLHRVSSEIALDSNGFGAVEACHLDCDLGRLTEVESEAPLVDLGVPLEDEPK